MTAATPLKSWYSKYVHNCGLFRDHFLEDLWADRGRLKGRSCLDSVDDELRLLMGHWSDNRSIFISVAASPLPKPFQGLPPDTRPVQTTSESDVEHTWIAWVLKTCLEYDLVNNQQLTGVVGVEKDTKDRPDFIVFPNAALAQDARNRQESQKNSGGITLKAYCQDGVMIVDAKKVSNGLEDPKDVEQVRRYLERAGKSWGVLTNGLSWRLMSAAANDTANHLRFDLVLLLEDARREGVTDEIRDAIRLFWLLFGKQGLANGYLDDLARESAAANRKVREVLQDNAVRAVELIAQGFWHQPDNAKELRGEGIDANSKPQQAQLDELRELSLVFLYRLLFVLKAEAQNLLPMEEKGLPTIYAQSSSTRAILSVLADKTDFSRAHSDYGFRDLKFLFEAIDKGKASEGIPAYNGGLFDDQRHERLARLQLNGDVVFKLLSTLVYRDGVKGQPVPYADLDVRDLGDTYEGLLELRLIARETDGKLFLDLRNQQGEKKASGSYFTPDGLVEHVVKKTLQPLLDACGKDARRVLALKVVDPAMGSGHFLVKAVDVIAWHLALYCDANDADAPPPASADLYKYWKRKVVENCVFGVDYNPMAVELAKLALWLHSASRGKPLSFLDHHFRVGNALIGIRIEDVKQIGWRSQAIKKGTAQSYVWEPRVPPPAPRDRLGRTLAAKKGEVARGAIQVGFGFEPEPLVISDIVAHVREILGKDSDKPADVKEKARRYREEVEARLQPYRLLCDLWCAQRMLADANHFDSRKAFETVGQLYDQVRKILESKDFAFVQTALDALRHDEILKLIERARNDGFGPRPLRFFHWQLEFPEVAFDENGHARETFGFDAVVGNPPWDKIKPAKRDYFGPFDPAVANTQGPSLDALISKLETRYPETVDGWKRYEAGMEATVAFLNETGVYTRQVALVNNKSTGGDPDVFKYFTERALHLVRPDGRFGLVVPSTLWQSEGCTALRWELFDKCALDFLWTFENYRKWAFKIDSRFKFTAFVAARARPEPEQTFTAGFMLRGLEELAPQRLSARLMPMQRSFAEAVSPETLALLDVRAPREAKLTEDLHARLPAFGTAKSGWNAKYRAELHMTNAAYLFKNREWLQARGCTRVWPERQADGTWQQRSEGPGEVAQLPEVLPEGGEYWLAAADSYYAQRDYEPRSSEVGGHVRRWWIHKEDLAKAEAKGAKVTEASFRILAGVRYAALFDGRLLHAFDHAHQRYVTGEGPKQIWDSLAMAEKAMYPRVFVNAEEAAAPGRSRVGFRDIARGTDSRTLLAALIPPECGAGNTIPTLGDISVDLQVDLTCVLNSMVADWILRFRVGAHVNLTQLTALPVPRPSDIPATDASILRTHTARLSCTTPELADVWNHVFPDRPWTYSSAERDLYQRSLLRAEIDAIVADLYGLSTADYAWILTCFPLLDRDQKELPGDKFVTDGDEKSKDKKGVELAQVGENIVELKPRSFVTRDLALLAYIRRKKAKIPADLHAFYRDEVGLDPDGPLSRFRIGEIRDLEARVNAARKAGAVAYVPSTGAAEIGADEDAQ